MPTRIVSTLDPNRLGPKLSLAQGNLLLTTTDACDFNRKVLGTVAIGAGKASFEVYVWSASQPQGGLVNMVSIGLAADGQCSLSTYTGADLLSFGLRPADGRVDNNGDEISSDSAGSIQPIAERNCHGVYADFTGSTPFAAWAVDGNTVFQCDLPTGYFWLPSISIGSSVAGDIQAQCNMGQNLLDFPNWTVYK